jgi:hypothetical protein
VDITKELPTVISFCSGYGGIERGLDLAGFEHRVIAYVEIEAFAIANLATRWNRVSWLQHLYTRILKPSQHTSFETKLALSLAVIPVSHLARQETGLEQTTPDTCGLTYGDTLNQLDLFPASLKTSKDTLASDSEMSLANWNKMVIKQRGEYSQRVKLAPLTRESESTSWPTPTASDWKNMDTASQVMLSKQVKMWPTPTAHLGKEGGYPAEYTRNTPTLTAVAMSSEKKSHSSGYLNPDWVEWLMGVPTGWTGLGSWETE